jgi:hypothetical protein
MLLRPNEIRDILLQDALHGINQVFDTGGKNSLLN